MDEILKMELFAFLLNVFTSANNVYYVEYSKEVACFSPANQALILTHCIEPSNSKSLLHCVAMCTIYSRCSAVLRDNESNCYFYKPCVFLKYSTECTSGDTYFDAFFKPNSDAIIGCGPQGLYSSVSHVCACQLGWSGLLCDIPPVDCTFLLTEKYPPSNYSVDLKLAKIITATCEITNSNYKFHVARNDGRSDHNKTIAEYSDGYTIDSNNFFLGLENIHEFAISGNRTLKIDIVFDSSISTFLNWTFSGVSIGNQSVNYAFTFSNFSCVGSSSTFCQSTNSICIQTAAGFSNWDTVTLLSTLASLVSKAGTGWWFERSLSLTEAGITSLACNPLGQLPSMSSTSSGRLTLPGLDMVNANYVSYFNYVSIYFYE